MIIIKTLHFEDYEDFACAVSDAYDRVKSDDGYNSVDVVVKYEDAKEIIRELVGMGYGIAFINEFGNPEWDGYDDAFVVSLLENEIWCEPVKRKDEYIFIEADVAYIFDDCNSKIVPLIESDEIFEVRIGDDDCDGDGDCENCTCENKLSSTATYKVNGKEVSEKEYNKALDNFHDRYMDGIASMLLGYSEFIDEMNEWKKLLDW